MLFEFSRTGIFDWPPPEYIMGHSMQAVGLLVHAAKSVFSVPLAVRIHEGLVAVRHLTPLLPPHAGKACRRRNGMASKSANSSPDTRSLGRE
jgi:hypothetical protein